MANIAINVVNGCFGVSLDQYEWTGLTVYDNSTTPVNVVPGQGGTYSYIQAVAGQLTFQAQVSSLGMANYGGETMVIQGANDPENFYSCTITYSVESGGSGAPNITALTGTCFQTVCQSSSASSIAFSQFGMTGGFLNS